MPVTVSPQSNNFIKVTQSNVLTVKNIEPEVLEPSSSPPFVLRQDTGVIGGVNDVFELSPGVSGDMLAFDSVMGKYKNYSSANAISISGNNLVLNSIDCGTF